MHVLHLPTAAAGHAWGLAQGERALGLNSHVLVAMQNWLNYPVDISLDLDRVSTFSRKSLRLISTFISIRNKYDILHFNFGRSLFYLPYKIKSKFPSLLKHFDLADLPLYSRNVKLFVTYNGCDARQKYPTIERTLLSACHNSDCYDGICNSGELDIIRRQSIVKMAKYVQHMWALNPDLLHFLPKEKSSFLPYSVNLDNISLAKPDFHKKKLKIVHAPTSRVVKGSDIILNVLEEVRKDHSSEIEVEVVENLSHERAINTYKQADLFVDQILIGWYGGVAIEVMSMGKPVICRIAEEDLHFIPRKMAADLKDAFINAGQIDLKEALLQCIEDRELLKRKSEAALEYARKWHDPKYVASITKEAYERF